MAEHHTLICTAANEKKAYSSELQFPVETEYARCIADLGRAGLLTPLPESRRLGVVGVDGNEYPLPTPEQVAVFFAQNREMVSTKFAQGFDRLELVPMAMPLPALMDRVRAAILKHNTDGTIFRARRFASDAPVPVRVHAEKQVWIWETLSQAIGADMLVYFPEASSGSPRGQTKREVIHNERLCAVPGWSVGLVETSSFLPGPGPGAGQTIGGRKQLEIGASPREYLRTLQTPPYAGETGRTMEEFLTRFLTQLETADTVSYDVADDNAFWCLGQYLKTSYAELVPTGRWIRDVGRVRLDMHRTGNKRCTKSWGASSTVRLPRVPHVSR